MRDSAAHLLPLLLLALRAQAQVPSEVPPTVELSSPARTFNMASVADGKSHCFYTYLERHPMDKLGLIDYATVSAHWPAKLCFFIPVDRAVCRWSYEVLTPGGQSYTSWTLRPNPGVLKPEPGWKHDLWTDHSEGYDENEFKGMSQDCTLAVNEERGGGYVLISATDLEKRLALGA
jgi:hypothetical protein